MVVTLRRRNKESEINERQGFWGSVKDDRNRKEKIKKEKIKKGWMWLWSRNKKAKTNKRKGA